jgi:hypothetical protein
VDHFIPRALYPLDLGHNFVLAHSECNTRKRDLLPSEEHLAAWTERNQEKGAELSQALDRVRVLNNLPVHDARSCVGALAYGNGGALTWRRKNELVPLRGARSTLLGTLF